MKKLISIILTCAMTLALVCQTHALDPQQTAADYLRTEGILQGDQNGDLHLDSNLTRSELAAILTRVLGNETHIHADQKFYLSQCTFTDVPDWARLYVGFCSANRLMVGYGDGIFGAGDSVTPAAACTVILRYLELPTDTWDYSTACKTAMELGLTDAAATTGDAITRGDLAIMLYRAMTGERGAPTDAADETHGLTYNSDGSINIPSDGSRYMPQTGDVIRCDDGSNYAITNASRYDKNMFASGPVGPLPEPTCDWSLLEMPELPKAEAKRITNERGDYLFICNQFETLRMCYTLFNAIVTLFSLWHLSNAYSPMLMTLFGIVMLSSLLHPSNACASMLFTPCNNVTVVSLIHPWNVISSIVVTVPGIVMLVRLSQALNALPLILVSPFGRVILFSFLHK